MIEDFNRHDPSIISFLGAARDFCRSIERFDWEDGDEFMVAINQSLIWLYGYGFSLPIFQLTKQYADTLEPDVNGLANALQNIKNNTPFQYYWIVLNPLDPKPPSTGTGDLIDDLHDIYKDLKLGLRYFDEVGGYEEFGLWMLKEGFRYHWSDHCVNAMQIIHEYFSAKS